MKKRHSVEQIVAKLRQAGGGFSGQLQSPAVPVHLPVLYATVRMGLRVLSGNLTIKLTGSNGSQRNCRPVQHLVSPFW